MHLLKQLNSRMGGLPAATKIRVQIENSSGCMRPCISAHPKTGCIKHLLMILESGKQKLMEQLNTPKYGLQAAAQIRVEHRRF